LEVPAAKDLCPNADLGITACIHLSLFLSSYLWFPFRFRCYDERALLFRTTISPFRSAPTAQRCCSPCPDKQRSNPSPAPPSFPCTFCRHVFWLSPRPVRLWARRCRL